MYWLDPTGKILGTFFAPFNEFTRLIAIDGTNLAYICGVTYVSDQGPETRCVAYRQDDAPPVWSHTLSATVNGVIGGAMAQGRLYVITSDGFLTALGDTDSPSSISTSAP
jgi:hypothetical protein